MTKDIFKHVIYFLYLFFCLQSYSCINESDIKETPKQGVITASFQDASCTEVWLKVTIENITLPAGLTLLKDSSFAEHFFIYSSDTIISVDSLLPARSYQFQLTLEEPLITGNKVTALTMDTTSNSFSWQNWTFGDIGSSRIYDAAIINENDIWCVGEIMVYVDSTRHEIFNAVHWNGVEWSLKKIMFYTICGQQRQDAYVASSILALSETEILVAAKGDQVAKIVNGVLVQTMCMPWIMTINKIWGLNSNDFYVAGNYGQFARYYNGYWTKIETGTELHFGDIYGSPIPGQEEYEILAVARQSYPLDKKLYKIRGNAAVEISTFPIGYWINSTWFQTDRHYYLAGDGIYEKKLLTEEKWKNNPLDITHYGTGCIRGDALNNIFAAGAFGELLHYNGIIWRSFFSEVGGFNGAYGAIAVKNNIVIAGGHNGPIAKILMGRRLE